MCSAIFRIAKKWCALRYSGLRKSDVLCDIQDCEKVMCSAIFRIPNLWWLGFIQWLVKLTWNPKEVHNQVKFTIAEVTWFCDIQFYWSNVVRGALRYSGLRKSDVLCDIQDCEHVMIRINPVTGQTKLEPKFRSRHVYDQVMWSGYCAKFTIAKVF